MRDMNELVTTFRDENSLHSNEGRSGVENLCQVVRAIGYQDKNFGAFSRKGAYGDLIEFLQDNPGAIEAIYNFIDETDIPEWKQSLNDQIEPDDDEY